MPADTVSYGRCGGAGPGTARRRLGSKRNAGVGVAAMWIGILVLVTFGGASLACLFIALRAGREGKWHVFVALLLPAAVIGGAIVMLVWKPILLELFGDDNLEDLPATARHIQGDALTAAHSDTTRFGWRYNEETETFHWYDEAYSADGGFKGQDDTGFTWSGGWDIVEGRMCLTLGQDRNCVDVYREGDDYYDVNHRDEIVNRFIMTGPVVNQREGGQPLAPVPMSVLIPGRTLSGEWLLHYGDPVFSASFAADGDAVSVARGADAGAMAREEAGAYAIDEAGKLCLMGVLHIVEECFAVVAAPGGLEIVRDRGRVVARVTAID